MGSDLDTPWPFASLMPSSIIAVKTLKYFEKISKHGLTAGDSTHSRCAGINNGVCINLQGRPSSPGGAAVTEDGQI